MTVKDINEIIKIVCPNDEDYEKPCISPKYLRQELEQLALEQEQMMLEPTTKNALEVDCVSRKQAVKTIQRYGVGCFDADEFSPEECERFVIAKLNELPSVTPQPRKGHWVDNKCTNCGYEVQPWNNTNFCPNCGADMREVEE